MTPPQTHYFMNQASKAPSKGYIKLYLSVIVLMHFFFLFFLKKMVEMHSSETTHKLLIKPTYSAQRTEPKDVFSLSFLGVFFQLFLQVSIQLE